MQVYNYLTRRKEELQPIHPGKIGMYVCGPTVYDHCHLGHARGYVSMDVWRRYLEFQGLEVRHIMNYTDVGHLVNDAETGEDKIEKKAKADKIDPIEIANTYIRSAEADFTALNIKPAHFNPRPSQYVAEIIKYVSGLIQKGFAYEVNGSVYFSVEKFPEYGKLSGRKASELLVGARVEANPEKRNPLDFALWIKASAEHILKWDSPWSLGYPGWHIECSVMSCDLLGQDTFDIHGGGVQNIFPHNENELTQSEAYLGEKMVNYWILWNDVNAEGGVKMSKSLGNQVTAHEALQKYGGSVIRLWVMSSHYRNPITYAEKSLDQARSNHNRLVEFIERLAAIKDEKEASGLDLAGYETRIISALDDDLNTPLALTHIYELITEGNKLIDADSLGQSEAGAILSLWNRLNGIFGLQLDGAETDVPESVQKLIAERQAARTAKDFAESDRLRGEIENHGFGVEDTKDGQKLKKI